MITLFTSQDWLLFLMMLYHFCWHKWGIVSLTTFQIEKFRAHLQKPLLWSKMLLLLALFIIIYVIHANQLKYIISAAQGLKQLITINLPIFWTNLLLSFCKSLFIIPIYFVTIPHKYQLSHPFKCCQPLDCEVIKFSCNMINSYLQWLLRSTQKQKCLFGLLCTVNFIIMSLYSIWWVFSATSQPLHFQIS